MKTHRFLLAGAGGGEGQVPTLILFHYLYLLWIIRQSECV